VSDRPIIQGDDPGNPARALALIRLAAVPVILVGERLVEHPELSGDPFDWVLAATAVYAAAAFVLSRSSRGRAVPGMVYAILDLGFICALAYTSGGPFSQIRYAFFVLPVGAAFLLSPRLTAGASLAVVAAYVAVSLPHPATNHGEDLEFILAQALYVTWMGLAAVVLSWILTRRSERIDQLAALRGRLVAEALDAEDRERRRLAEALHDEAVQNLLAARQELREAERGDSAGLERARLGIDRAVEQLRGTVSELHPYLLERAGLSAALEAVAEEQGRRGRFHPRVRVAPDIPKEHAQLVLSVARELLVNAAKHASAGEVTVAVAPADGHLVLEVADDGQGIDPARLRDAPADGHVGLASCAQRVEAVGGRFHAIPLPDGGTRMLASIPLEAAERELDGNAHHR
jgi:two-component system, NarL family, sensor kinase